MRNLPQSVQGAIAERCGSIVSQRLIWEAAAGKALAAGASEKSVAVFLQGMRSGRHFTVLVERLSGAGSGLDAFLTELTLLVDESAFDFQSWLAAFERVQDYLVKRGGSASPASVLGYLQCSSEFGAAGQGQGSLPETISQMLERYGFEGEEGCGIARTG